MIFFIYKYIKIDVNNSNYCTMKIKNMVNKKTSPVKPGTVVEQRGKFVNLPVDLLFRIKLRAAEDTLQSGHHVSETDVIQSALEAYLK